MKQTVRPLSVQARRCYLRTACSAAVLGLWFLGGSAQALDITTCSQTVPAGDTGNLTGDLDCSSLLTGAAVTLGQRGVLAMNGFTIRASTFAAVYCDNRCTVQGPGEIIGGGIFSPRGLTLTDVYIHNSAGGVKAFAGPGLLHPGSLRMTNVTVTDIGDVNSGGECVVGGKVTANNVTVARCGSVGLFGIRWVRGTTVTVTDCASSGVSSRRVFLDGLVAQGNGVGTDVNGSGAGVEATGTVRLLNSVVTGNKFRGTDLDILTTKLPVLSATTCDHSGQGSGFTLPVATWGVCRLD